MNPALEAGVSSASAAHAATREPDAVAEPIALDVMQAYRQIVARQRVLIDVRPGPEYARLRIPDALHLPTKMLKHPWKIRKLYGIRRDTPICVYAAAGAGSRWAAAKLQRQGYCKVAYLSEGFAGWQHKGLPCVSEIDGELVQVVTECVGLPWRVIVFD